MISHVTGWLFLGNEVDDGVRYTGTGDKGSDGFHGNQQDPGFQRVTG